MASDRSQTASMDPPAALPDAQLPRLMKIFNSLTRSKDDFAPVDTTGKLVIWYACGPTVYQDAHLGHAKNYLSTDIIRRIMKDYFGFRVKFVMNTTEIDDKIIVQGRKQYLLACFKQEHAAEDDPVSDSVLAEVQAAFKQYVSKNLPSLPSDTSPETFCKEADKASLERAESSSLTDQCNSKTATSCYCRRFALQGAH